MPIAQFLADLSVWIRYMDLGQAARARLDDLCSTGVVGTCGIVELRLLGAVRDTGTYAMAARLRRASMVMLDMRDADVQRALKVQALLAESANFDVSWPALLVAAVAERHQVTMLHASVCFDVIASMTGQAAEWSAPP
jgi:predicted nucleic acid-binding protein